MDPTSIAAVGSLVGGLTSLFTSKKAPPTPKVAPTADDEASRRKKEREMQRQYGTSGYQGADLSGGKLG